MGRSRCERDSRGDREGGVGEWTHGSVLPRRHSARLAEARRRHGGEIAGPAGQWGLFDQPAPHVLVLRGLPGPRGRGADRRGRRRQIRDRLAEEPDIPDPSPTDRTPRLSATSGWARPALLTGPNGFRTLSESWRGQGWEYWVRSFLVELHLSQDTDADALLSSNPFALLVGMVLDQQVPLEWAFASPLELERRLGQELEPKRIAHMDPEAFAAAFSAKAALHRYPGSMAARGQELAKLVVDRYGGRTEAIWEEAPSGTELFRRVKELPGFGEHKAKIFVALLGKQLGVRPQGWESVSAPFSDAGTYRSVADITDPDTL